MLTYEDARNLLGKRDKKRMPGRATWLTRKHTTNGKDPSFFIRQHHTNIVEITPWGTYRINTGGHHTVSTKRKINFYSPANLCQKNWVWYFGNGSEYYENAELFPNGRFVPQFDPITHETL